MKYVAVISGASSAILYVQELFLRGYKPIIINPPGPELIEMKNFRKLVGEENAIFIDMKDDSEFDALVEKLREYDVDCVVAGAEPGVEYADKFAYALGKPGNSPETTYKRRSKNGMHEALKNHGVRYIRGAVVKSEKDIIDFWDKNKIEIGFMKYTGGAGSVGNKICKTKEEAIEHFYELKDSPTLFGQESPVILQEFIDGDEYVVNSVSCEGKHMITDIWRYHRFYTPEGDVNYESMRVIVRPMPGLNDLIKYAYKVLDATEFKYGPCHGEYKIDSKGPILIETNARPMGASLNVELMDEAVGHHITDIALDSYLDRDRFFYREKQPYRPRKEAIIKCICSPVEREVNMFVLSYILNSLSSYRYTVPVIEDKIVQIHKTVNLETHPALVMLCNEDVDLVNAECDYLHTLETKYFDLMFVSNEKIVAEDISDREIKEIMDVAMRTKKILIVTNKGKYIGYLGKIEKTDEPWGMYDGMIYARTKGFTFMDMLFDMKNNIGYIRSGGGVVVTGNVYENLPYKSVSIEVIMKILGLTVNIPKQDYGEVVYGIKR